MQTRIPIKNVSVKELKDVYVHDFYSKQLADIQGALKIIIFFLGLIAGALIFK